MKKIFCVLMALLMLGACDSYNHEALENDLNDLKSRVAALEEWTETVNSNISALQDIVAALQDSDYVTGVSPFTSPVPGGYIISFVKSGDIVISNGADGKNGTAGKDGVRGKSGESPLIGVKQDAGVYYWTLNGEWITSGGNKLRVSGERGADGGNGQNGITPQLHINSSNIWEISYDGGTWTSLGVAATGAGGQDGQNGITPQLRINSSNIWEVSYNSGSTWTSLGVAATGGGGQNGQDGQNGLTPMIRINPVSSEWEISLDSGVSWTGTGTVATGDKGDKGDTGDAVFAADGVDFSDPEYVEFTLADGISKIKVPKYKKLGLYYTQPGIFAAGETKVIAYTPEGNVAVVRFVDVPEGWQANVNQAARTFTVTAPASGGGGEAAILVSDNDQAMIMRTINLNSNAGGGGGDGGGDDGGGDNPGGGDDGGNTGNGGNITVDGYSGNTLTLYYTDDMSEVISRNSSNVFVAPANSKIIKNIVLEGNITVIAGRKADGSAIALRVSGGDLALRDYVGMLFIPVGTYSEFQLVRTKLNGTYKQEASLDLLNIEWAPVGTSSSKFTGTFDGNGYTLANLKITGNNNYAGLFGASGGTIRNVRIVSGSVSGKDYVGSICGNASSTLTDCSNGSNVSGSNYVGGVCGSGTASGCHNTGSVSGTVRYTGGVCGSGGASNCYNTGQVSGAHYIGGICGTLTAAITACYNTGLIFGSGNYIGGICGYNTSYSITACYNTANISGGDHYIGGICGDNYSSPSSTVACYNTGAISGNGSYIGGVCGRNDGTATACYWKDVSGDKAVSGIGGNSNTGTTVFAYDAWPTTTANQQWGTGNGNSGKYWKSLGEWNDGNPIYPKLWFED
ncbi:MAG: hypothetical protein LBL04_13050 [Bacteroidales bacterium]|nr:hypothetical protein [Bacteroidales bacterium]